MERHRRGASAVAPGAVARHQPQARGAGKRRKRSRRRSRAVVVAVGALAAWSIVLVSVDRALRPAVDAAASSPPATPVPRRAVLDELDGSADLGLEPATPGPRMRGTTLAADPLSDDPSSDDDYDADEDSTAAPPRRVVPLEPRRSVARTTQRAPWRWLGEDVQELLLAEESSGDAAGATEPLTPRPGAGEHSPELEQVLSLLKLMTQRVNWDHKEGRGRRREKEAVVLGQAGIVRRDFSAVSQAYAAMGVSVVKASDVSAAVARGRVDGNLRSVRGRDWGVILCLSLKTDKCLSMADFERLESEQAVSARINRVAALQQVLWSKDRYCSTVQRSGKWLDAFTFACWVLPRDEEKLHGLLGTMRASGGGATWIVKPYKQGGGRGIFVLDTEAELEALLPQGRKVVVQPYLEAPHLLEGRKWDLRTYVLLTGVQPAARAYVFRDGLVRLATEAYDASARHGGNKTQFLTNTSVNKNKVKDMDTLTWSFARLEETMGRRHYEVLFSRIKRALGMLLVTSEQAFAEAFSKIGPRFACSNCYHVLGVDLIVDRDLFPRVIEVNGEPSMLLSGASQSHYDLAKSQMQQEVARIVLQPQRKLATRTAGTLARAGVSREDLRWLATQERPMLYLMQLQREAASLESFSRVYPDADACASPARREVWRQLLDELGEPAGASEGWRARLHDVAQRFVCALDQQPHEA